ncbi:cytochrome c oxidase subunit 3 family protein [Amphritea pacifica]|uniref:Cytochrome c oxidase subunit 3 family protein n=1 Tax=Amphritea pacifica TaxID=2811233 RepID=A0ABS2WCB2_9GAMM|nr:cytochrome c oxidase subunit 3 family protein [Amphritea pacifica]MBN0989218.1 cytochrome c oxidase subunit 3 family protein [Amphritea pacifica]
MNAAEYPQPVSATKILPGDFAVWLFIFAELSVFALLFLLFAITRVRYPEMFAQGQASISTAAGLANTLALLTSSYFVVIAQRALLNRQRIASVINLLLALSCAGLYLGVKSGEYQHLAERGFGFGSNDFYFFYFGLTGFHMLHVILGMLVLLFLSHQVYRGRYHCERMNEFESGACYWHMVDLLWLMLFPLVYVLQA